MARRQRLQVIGFPVHIIQRGNNRQACFYAEADYQFFLHHLATLARRFKCELHAYALMTNHFHLLLTPYLARCPSLLMKLLGQRYVQYIKKTYRRSGSLWDGRFRISSSCARSGCQSMAAMRSAAAVSERRSNARSNCAQCRMGPGAPQAPGKRND
ncbi:MAG: transposase [Gammaproteobacteria bacterium]|nr:transposase [Gammaproteobacteria bacterium]MDH3412179.1 transposase [Gammaproteobacteria bacterium]